jgi:RNA polymerase sigma-70 factor (ECF subfamily)
LSPWQHATDEHLLERTRCGDAAAFQQIYERYREATFRFACLMLGSSEQAEDVTHDCFMSLIRNPGRFDSSRASLRTYLYATARNLVSKLLRRASKESRTTRSATQELVVRPKQPLVDLLDMELAEKVREALAVLPHPQREAIVLFEYEDQSLADIATITGAEVGTIKWRLHQARAKLRHKLAPYLNGDVYERGEKSNHA